MKKLKNIVLAYDKVLLDIKPVLQKNLTKNTSNSMWTHHFYELYEAIKKGKVASEKEMSKIIKIDYPSQTFQKAKTEFEDWLVNTICFIKGHNNYTNRQQLFNALTQEDLNAVGLINILGSPVAEKYMIGTFKSSKKASFSGLLSINSRRLMAAMTVISPGDAKIQEYGDIYLKYDAIYEAEEKLLDAYEDIFIIVKTANSGLGNISNKVDAALILAQSLLEEFDSYDLQATYFKLLQLRLLFDKDTDGLLKMSGDAVDYFEQHDVESVDNVAIYKYQRALCFLHKGEIILAEEILLGLLKNKKISRPVYMAVHFLLFVVLYKQQKFVKVLELVLKAVKKDLGEEVEFDNINLWLEHINWLILSEKMGLLKLTPLKKARLLDYEKQILDQMHRPEENLSDLMIAFMNKEMEKAALLLINLHKKYASSFAHNNGKRHEIFFEFIKYTIENNLYDHDRYNTDVLDLNKLAPNYLSEYYEYETYPYDLLMKGLYKIMK